MIFSRFSRVLATLSTLYAQEIIFGTFTSIPSVCRGVRYVLFVLGDILTSITGPGRTVLGVYFYAILDIFRVFLAL